MSRNPGVQVTVDVVIFALRDRSAGYREVGDGRIENVYRVRVLNMDQAGHAYSLHAEGPRGIEVVYRAEELYLGPGEIRDLAVRVRIAPDELEERSTGIALVLRSISFNFRVFDPESMVGFLANPLLQPFFEGLILVLAVSLGAARVFRVKNRLQLFG